MCVNVANDMCADGMICICDEYSVVADKRLRGACCFHYGVLCGYLLVKPSNNYAVAEHTQAAAWCIIENCFN